MIKSTSILIGTVVIFPATIAGQQKNPEQQRPNILYIMADDHASQAISCYGGILKNVLPTPNIDRIANEGIRLDNCFVTNSISTPSRAAILTGQYSQCNGVYTLADKLQPGHPNMAKEFQKAGYQTAIIGKWHLGTEPEGFNFYNVLPGQGRYYDPQFITKGEWEGTNFEKAERKIYEGHSTDVIAGEAIRWMNEANKEEPFFLMCHFKAPHRPWQPAERFKELLKDVQIPEPENILEYYADKGPQAERLRLRLEDMNETDLKTMIPANMSRNEKRHWAYQLYIKDYLRCIAGIDENVGKILQFLDDNGLTENTIVVYTSDQGFFLGEHGFFDKRLMYEESLRMPFVIRYPKALKPGSINKDIIINVDFAPTFLDFAGIPKPVSMQGESFRSNLLGKAPLKWRKSMYYRYWMHNDNSHHVTANYGIRTERHKLIFNYGLPLNMKGTGKTVIPPTWEFYDLKEDRAEMKNQYQNPSKQSIIKQLKKELLQLKNQYKDEDSAYPEMKSLVEKYW